MDAEADVEFLTVFNALLGLRETLGGRPQLYAEDLDFLAFAAKRAPLSNSQLLQDIWVLYELGEKRGGYFVEFGVCDGVSLSNTLLLEKAFGWQGAVAEPARVWQDALHANRNCYITSKCVHATDGLKLVFREVFQRELSTLEGLADADFHAASRTDGAQQYEVETITLQRFLEQARAQRSARRLQVEDGWTYFLHGWTQVIAEVFDVAIPTSGPDFEALSRIAIESGKPG